jgi:hypothetical protein
MSTIMTFSAWSLAEARSATICWRSSARVRPRGAVPFIGLERTRSPSISTKSSGEAEQMAWVARSR